MLVGFFGDALLVLCVNVFFLKGVSLAIAKLVHLSVAGRSLAHAWSLWDRARSCRIMTHHLL